MYSGRSVHGDWHSRRSFPKVEVGDKKTWGGGYGLGSEIDKNLRKKLQMRTVSVPYATKERRIRRLKRSQNCWAKSTGN
jgi:hypothetical protein